MKVGDILICKKATTMDLLLHGIEYGKGYKISEIHHNEIAILIDDLNLVWYTKSKEIWKNFPYYGDYFCINVKEERKIKLEILNDVDSW